MGFPSDALVKNLPANAGNTRDAVSGRSEMATHSIICAWKNCMNRGVWQTVVYGVSKESDMTEQLSACVHTRRHTCTFNDLYLLVSKLSFIN